MAADERDPEKGEVPKSLHGSILHPGAATEKDGEISIDNGREPEDDSDRSNHSSIDTIAVEPVAIPQDAPRAKSRSSSVRSRPVSIVPRSERRGLLGRFAIIPEVESPLDYTRRIKWTITFIVAMAAAAAPMGSAIFYRTYFFFLVKGIR